MEARIYIIVGSLGEFNRVVSPHEGSPNKPNMKYNRNIHCICDDDDDVKRKGKKGNTNEWAT